ncbi:cytochrome c oxidase subunit 3 [Benzoatithermus flavus]|uniref:Cytochrome c oxidase subunit 3 n=1 Tax=Benzoatithermus flavus TaxID=3108223 RepID=A0ABU8XVI1_9PROT
MRQRFVHDVSGLPDHDFGSDSIVWWGTLGFVAIEGMGFVLAVAVYFYLMREVPSWPPGSIAPPGLIYGSLFTGVLLVSALPNHWAKRAAERYRRRGSLLGMGGVVLLGIGLLVLRGFEFTVLHVRWDTNAYGSIVWTLLGLHTLHLGTDVADTAVLLALFLTDRDPPQRRYTDVSENADYWWFVLLAWLPIFAVVYLVPRLG